MAPTVDRRRKGAAAPKRPPAPPAAPETPPAPPPGPTVPVTYVDLTDAEEGLILATLDPSGDLAGRDEAKLRALLEQTDSDDVFVRELLMTLSKDAEADRAKAAAGGDDTGASVAALQLMPYEKYDYVVLMFRNTHDWDRACEVLGLQPAAFDYATGRDPAGRRKIGFGRVVDGAPVIAKLCAS